MELENLNKILDAMKEDYDKQNNLKKFYKQTLTEEEYKNFEKLLKNNKSQITELEGIVKKMSQYSDQYEYERIMAMSETEFNSIRDEEIYLKKQEIKDHNREINKKNASISEEIEKLNRENESLKVELEEMTNNIAETGKFTKESVEKAKKIKNTIQSNNEKIKEDKVLIEDNGKDIIINDDISLDFDSYKEQKLSKLSKKNYVENIPEVSVMDEFLCKLQKKGKTKEEIETALNEFKGDYVGGFEEEGYEYFDPIYRADLGVKEESNDSQAAKVTELLEKYFDVVEKGEKGSEDKAIIERKMLVRYNTNKRHNISEITKERLLKELIDGGAFYKTIKNNSVVEGGCFLNLNDRISILKERLLQIEEWKEANSSSKDYLKIITLIDDYKEVSKTRKAKEEYKEKIKNIVKSIKTYFGKDYLKNNTYTIKVLSLFDDISNTNKEIKSLNSEKEKITNKKIVINKKDQLKNVQDIDKQIKAYNIRIDEDNKEILEILSLITSVLEKVLKEPEKLMYPEEETKDQKSNIFNVLHKKAKNVDFSVSSEEDYLYELEKDLQKAKVYLDAYKDKKESNKKASVAYLCAKMDISSVSESTINALMDFKIKNEQLKATEIGKRVNEARINLYLREQKEKAQSEASKAKSEILGAVLNHIDLDETKTDIFAAL